MQRILRTIWNNRRPIRPQNPLSNPKRLEGPELVPGEAQELEEVEAMVVGAAAAAAAAAGRSRTGSRPPLGLLVWWRPRTMRTRS